MFLVLNGRARLPTAPLDAGNRGGARRRRLQGRARGRHGRSDIPLDVNSERKLASEDRWAEGLMESK